MSSVIILGFDGFLNNNKKLASINFYISFMKAENYYSWSDYVGDHGNYSMTIVLLGFLRCSI